MRQSSHRAPPTAPPSNCEGDLWGDLQAVGRETGSLLRLLKNPTHPQPLPLREGAMPTPRPPVGGSKGVRARGSVSGEPGPVLADCSRFESFMANAHVIQRQAHLAGAVKCFMSIQVRALALLAPDRPNGHSENALQGQRVSTADVMRQRPPTMPGRLDTLTGRRDALAC